jgi:hypothetical protein
MADAGVCGLGRNIGRPRDVGGGCARRLPLGSRGHLSGSGPGPGGRRAAQRPSPDLSTGRRRLRRSGRPTRSHAPDNCPSLQRGGAAIDSFRSGGALALRETGLGTIGRRAGFVRDGLQGPLDSR